MEWGKRLFSINKHELFDLLDKKVILVRLRCGILCSIIYNPINSSYGLYDKNFNYIVSFDCYGYNLTYSTEHGHILDIIKIYSVLNYSYINKSFSELHPYLLWESQKEKVKLTLSDIAKKFGVDSNNIEIVK